MALVILAAVLYIIVQGYSDYKEDKLAQEQQEKQEIYLQGAQYGQLLERQNILNTIQQQGYYTMELFDQNNQTVTVALDLIQQQQP